MAKTYQQGYDAGFSDVCKYQRKPQFDLKGETPFNVGYIKGLNNGWLHLLGKQRIKRENKNPKNTQ